MLLIDTSYAKRTFAERLETCRRVVERAETLRRERARDALRRTCGKLLRSGLPHEEARNEFLVAVARADDR